MEILHLLLLIFSILIAFNLVTMFAGMLIIIVKLALAIVLGCMIYLLIVSSYYETKRRLK